MEQDQNYLCLLEHTIFIDPEGAITSNYVAKASFSVSGEKTVTVSVETMSLPYNAGVISGVSELMNIDGGMTYYRFTPVQSGAYTIRSVSPKGKDVDGYLYGPQGEFINFNADGNNIDIATEDNQTGYVSNGIDFKIKANLEAGRTYYIAVTDCNDRPDLETTVIIERVEQQ